jgi:hypothetical protein
MRWTPVLFLILVLSACSHSDDKDHSVAHEVGKAAYKVTQASEKVAKKAGQELKEATKEAHSGWKDAKHDDKVKRTEK